MKTDDDDWDNWMDESQKELQNIFQGQSAMKEILTELHRKMDDIISRQERAFNAITTIKVIYKLAKIRERVLVWEYRLVKVVLLIST